MNRKSKSYLHIHSDMLSQETLSIPLTSTNLKVQYISRQTDSLLQT